MKTTIQIDKKLKRLLEIEKTMSEDYNSLEDVLKAKIDFQGIERKFSKLFDF